MLSFNTKSRTYLPLLPILKSCFFLKQKILNVFETLLFQSHSKANLQEFGYKNFQKESSGRGILPGQLTSKRENKNVGVKKMIFPPYLNMGAKY